MSQAEPLKTGITLAWEQKYSVAEINSLLLLAESPLGQKMMKDLTKVLTGIDNSILSYASNISNSHANLPGLVEKIACLKESKKLLERFKIGFFDPVMLNEKYNEAYRLENDSQTTQSAPDSYLD